MILTCHLSLDVDTYFGLCLFLTKSTASLTAALKGTYIVFQKYCSNNSLPNLDYRSSNIFGTSLQMSDVAADDRHDRHAFIRKKKSPLCHKVSCIDDIKIRYVR